MTSQRPVITEEQFDTARAGFFASVQYLNKHITEEPITSSRAEA